MGRPFVCSRLALPTVLVMVMLAAPLSAQGKGHAGEGKQKDKARGASNHEARGADAPKAKGKTARSEQRIERKLEREFAGEVDLPRDNRGKQGARGRFLRQVVASDLRPSVRQFFRVDRAPQRIVSGAVARAHLRGLGDDAMVIHSLDDRVRILNRAGVVLVDLDEERARNLGRWDVVPVGDRLSENAPSFCRSGAGHPVFGRAWCLDKGFGLASDRDVRWARTTRLDDVVFLQPAATGLLSRDALVALLGSSAFDRLALHAITLGLAEPLMGRWMGEASGRRVLLLTSNDRPVAEIVDANRDSRADVMVVGLRDW